ncbi:DUF397 domain-containing protein [Streptomyces sp. NPDC020298]|uniref:DUF397 domain-containing protein n=1 Tax=unclassified Streptomyces TaxID=2593676 RepID=UPI003406485B
MPELVWQKSTYSAEAANCLYVAAAPTGTLHLHESDEPMITLTTTKSRLGTLIRTLKTHPELLRP